LGAVKNTNSTTPTNLEEKFAGMLEQTTEDDENWTTVSNKSPPRNTDKRNRESTPVRQAKTDTAKAAKKGGSPMTDKDSSPKRPNNPNVVTEEKPENPKQKSFPTAGKKPENAPKENPNPVASPPKLGRNPQQPDIEAALEPETNTPVTGNGNNGKAVPEATPTLPNTTSGSTGEPEKTSAPTAAQPHPTTAKANPTTAKTKTKQPPTKAPTATAKERQTKRTKTKIKINTTRNKWNSRSNHTQSIRKPLLAAAT